MKKRLIAAAFVFIGILAAVTAVVGGFNAGEPETDCGEFIVSVNEIERLITNGDTQAALECAANLKGELSSFSPETSGGGLWIVFAASAAIISAAFGYVWFYSSPISVMTFSANSQNSSVSLFIFSLSRSESECKNISSVSRETSSHLFIITLR